jgi:hypothetical protein
MLCNYFYYKVLPSVAKEVPSLSTEIYVQGDQKQTEDGQIYSKLIPEYHTWSRYQRIVLKLEYVKF